VTVDDREEQENPPRCTRISLRSWRRCGSPSSPEWTRSFSDARRWRSLEVTAAQFSILKIVLKGNALASACELCKFMDYDRGRHEPG